MRFLLTHNKDERKKDGVYDERCNKFDREFGQGRDAAFQRGRRNRYVFNGNATRMESSRFKFAYRHVVSRMCDLIAWPCTIDLAAPQEFFVALDILQSTLF